MSAQAIAATANRAETARELVGSFVRSPGVQSNSPTVIVAGDIVEHLGNLDGFLRSADSALADGGMIIVQSPNPWYWRNVVKSVLATEVPNNAEHTCWFCPRTWRQLVERYGFTLGAIQFDARYPRDIYMPLPRGVKYPAWSLETVRTA